MFFPRGPASPPTPAAATALSPLLLSFVLLRQLAPSACVWGPSKPLSFGADGSVKILQVADTHVGENYWMSWGPEQDQGTKEALQAVLEFEAPDLVVFSGDQVTANNVYLNATSFWGMLVEVVSGAGIPWAAIFGNHDDQPLDYPGSTSVFGVPRGTPAQTTRSDLLGYDKSFSLSRSLAMFNSSSGGKGIGYLLVGKSPENPEPAAVIWLMDTGGGSLQQVLEKDDWRCFGMRKDGIATVDRSPPDALRSLSNANVQAVSVGHCHGNDECCTSSLEPWMPSLCFGRHSGLGGYNRGWEHGGRVFVLDSASPTKIATHVRLRDGSVVSSGVIGTANPLPHISTS